MRMLFCFVILNLGFGLPATSQEPELSTVLDYSAETMPAEASIVEGSNAYFDHVNNYDNSTLPVVDSVDSYHAQDIVLSNADRQRSPAFRSPRKCKCRTAKCGCKSKAALGFAVEEVQYGANAGLPSFGYISHGPWTTLQKRELLSRRFLLSRCKSKWGAKKCRRKGCKCNRTQAAPSVQTYPLVHNGTSSLELYSEPNIAVDSYPLHDAVDVVEPLDNEPFPVHQ